MNKEIWHAYQESMELSDADIKALVLSGCEWRTAKDGLTRFFIENEFEFEGNKVYLAKQLNEGEDMPQFER